MSDADASALDFIIVGASVSGLSSAIALKASGHRVLVLEKDAHLGGSGSVPNGSGCAQVPPNGCKIFSDWGLEAELQANSAPISGFSVFKYDQGPVSPDFIGNNRWDEEMLTEARGGYAQLAHRELIRILYEFALKPTDDHSTLLVSIIFGAEVVQIDSDSASASVTLRSGEKYTADGVIGADGARGVVRRILSNEEGISAEDDMFTGISAYNAIIPRALVYENNLEWFYNFPSCTVWISENRGARTFPIGKDQDLSLLIYTPDDREDPTWTEVGKKKLLDVLGPCDHHIRKLAALAGPATGVQIKNYCHLKSWVSESGRILAVGDAAHPSAPGSLHSYSCSLEDGVFVGKLFSHTRNPKRVPEFFRAFQEHREPRCTRIVESEKEVLRIILLPEGPMKTTLEASMRAKEAAGENVLEGDLDSLLEDFIMVFSYDARDDADEWWVSWGRYGDGASMAIPFDSSSDKEIENGYDYDAKWQDPGEEYLAAKLNHKVSTY